MIINGVINLNKRKGISSFKATREVRRAVGASKAGHTGTLDPEATGVLPICLGKTTRIVDYLMKTEKEYHVKMFLGIKTDTCDLEGTVIGKKDILKLDFTEIEKTINSFKGSIMQVPPIYSAIKVQGRKLYEYARKGESVDIRPRKVEIYYINNINIIKSIYLEYKVYEVNFTVGCSKGTYIRSLCRDIGESLGCYGVMAGLTRSITGKFNLENSYNIEEITNAVENGQIESIISKAEDLLDLPIIILDDIQYDAYMNGRKVVIIGIEKGEYLVKSNKGETIGIGVADDVETLKGRKRLL
ncbi:MAG: tRNA pseudouridine(55) synthase TruB [Clostridiales bacterium]|nr:tRNA pseudouridine(55) synthase TruB [Clostridiales bacterium]